MGANITIEVGEITTRAIKGILGNLERKTPSVLKNAINMTARRTRKELIKGAREKYTLRSSKRKEGLVLRSASASNLVATFTVRGKMHQLIYFQTRHNSKKRATRARVRKDRSLKELVSSTGGKAFIATMKNGSENNHDAVVQRQTKNRYPLLTFAGPSTPEMIGSKEVYGKIAPNIRKELVRNINRQIQRVMKGR